MVYIDDNLTTLNFMYANVLEKYLPCLAIINLQKKMQLSRPLSQIILT